MMRKYKDCIKFYWFTVILAFVGILGLGTTGFSAQVDKALLSNMGNPVLNASNGHLTNARMFSGIMADKMMIDQSGSGSGAVFGSQTCGFGYSMPCGECPRSEAWGSFTQNWTQQTTSGSQLGYDYNPFAFAFGKDRRVGDWTFGVAGQYTHGDLDGGYMTTTDTKIDSATLGIYSSRFGTKNYFMSNMQFGVGWNKENTYDSILGNEARGSYHSATLGTGFEFGHSFKYFCTKNPFTITPHIGADYWFLNREAFDESGTVARSFGSANYNVVEIPIGLRLARKLPMTGGKANWLLPSIDFVYARSVADTAPVSNVGLMGSPLSWDARGSDLGRDIFRMSTGLTGRYCRCIDLGLSYDVETRNNYNSQQFTVMLVFTR